jgi:hypothetical protein
MKCLARPTPLLPALAAAAMLLACGHGESGGQADTAAADVLEWNAFASDLVAANQPAPVQTHSMAVVQIAVHDALNAVQARYQPYRAVAPAAAAGASPAAAVAAATHDTLVQVLPAAASAAAARYSTKLAALPDGDAKTAGIAAGRAAAAAILALRQADDLFALLSRPYTPGPAAPGTYQPTPPLNIVVGAGWGGLTPFALTSGTQFRSPAPVALNSAAYTRDYQEAKDLGSAASTLRSTEQTQTAHFWYDAATREWHDAARQALADTRADGWQAARALALLSIAMADVGITSLETKFAHHFWRPITAIVAGDSDGNDATTGDPQWLPLCVTPPFPEHNSAHAATGTAAAQVLASLLGDERRFSVTSPTLAGSRREYRRFSDAAAEEGLSRIYCGIHFRQGLLAGEQQGRQVAHHVLQAQLRALTP